MASAPTESVPRPGTELRAAVRHAVPSWLIARVLVAGALLAGRWIVDRGVDDPLARTTARQGLLAWDGAFYADLAQHGYARLPREALRFFPLTPILGRAVGWFGIGPRVGVVIVANIGALIAGALLWTLVRGEDFGDARTAGRAVWFLALAPSAFVLVFGYAEGVFVALTVGVFVTVRRRNWWWAVLLGAGAGLSRPGGFVVAIPVFVEALRSLRSVSPRELASRAAAVLAPFAGTGAFLWWVGDQYGDALLPYRVQTQANLKGTFTSPVTSVSHALQGLAHGHIGTGLHVPWMIVAGALTVVAFRRLPASYGWFAVVSLASAVTSNNLDSFERYALGAFPLVIVVALLAHRQWVERVLLIVSGTAMTGYTVLAITHAYVP